MGFESLMKLKGIRTTLSFWIVSAFAGTGMLTGILDAAPYLDFQMKLFLAYIAIKAVKAVKGDGENQS